jgi:hypothetical protein
LGNPWILEVVVEQSSCVICSMEGRGRELLVGGGGGTGELTGSTLLWVEKAEEEVAARARRAATESLGVHNGPLLNVHTLVSENNNEHIVKHCFRWDGKWK